MQGEFLSQTDHKTLKTFFLFFYLGFDLLTQQSTTVKGHVLDVNVKTLMLMTCCDLTTTLMKCTII